MSRFAKLVLSTLKRKSQLTQPKHNTLNHEVVDCTNFKGKIDEIRREVKEVMDTYFFEILKFYDFTTKPSSARSLASIFNSFETEMNDIKNKIEKYVVCEKTKYEFYTSLLTEFKKLYSEIITNIENDIENFIKTNCDKDGERKPNYKIRPKEQAELIIRFYKIKIILGVCNTLPDKINAFELAGYPDTKNLGTESAPVAEGFLIDLNEITKNPIEKTDFKIFKDDFFFTEYKKMQSYFKDSGALQKCVNVEISKGGKAKQKTKKQKLKSGKKNKNKSKRRKGSRKK